ncbi:MAG: hypothetical protein ACI9G1_002315 [Pirellulaceae bacterium]|jgi:hypothetical protein
MTVTAVAQEEALSMDELMNRSTDILPAPINPTIEELGDIAPPGAIILENGIAQPINFEPAASMVGYGADWWVQADYLMWWTKGAQLPPLVTTGTTTTPGDAGVLGVNGTSTLFGGTQFDDVASGGRLRIGRWHPNWIFGLEGEYLALESRDAQFSQTSGGDPLLARPFFNALTDAEDAELVAFPGILAGTVSVEADSQFQSAGARMIFHLLCCQGCAQDKCACGGCQATRTRLDFLAGYRFLRLNEGVIVREDLADVGSDATFLIRDQFDAQTQFHGGEVGFRYQTRRSRWTVDLLGKVAAGNSHQRVNIDGSTITTTGGITFNHTGGLLTQTTNIGHYTRDRFSFVPEVGASLGYNLTSQLRATVGYTMIYWSNVVRPGDHIDTVVNPNLLPPAVDPLVGPSRPQFAFNDTHYWAQGLNFGLHYRW